METLLEMLNVFLNSYGEKDQWISFFGIDMWDYHMSDQGSLKTNIVAYIFHIIGRETQSQLHLGIETRIAIQPELGWAEIIPSCARSFKEFWLRHCISPSLHH